MIETLRVWAVQPGEKKDPVSPYCGFSIHKGGLHERWKKDFLPHPVVTSVTLLN